MFESAAISKFQKFLNDYHRSFVEAIETKDVSTINLGSGIGQEEFQKLLRRKVVNIFQKLWGKQIEKITEDRVIQSINIKKLPEGFLDDLDRGIDDWITNDWNPVYAEAVEVAATGKEQITGLIDKINQSTGISTIFKPNTQRMIDFIDEQGLDLAEKLKVQQKKSLRNTLRRSLKDGWTRDVTISDMKRNVSLTDRESQWLLNFESRQRKALLKEFKERFPKLKEEQIRARVENVVQRRKRRKYKFYQRSRSERFYRTELVRARNDGNLEAIHQATERGAIKNAKKKWVKRNQVDNWESSDKYNEKFIDFDEDFFKKFGKPRETTMLNGKGPGEINELCGLEFFAEKGDGKPVEVPFVPAKTLKEAEDYAVEKGFGKKVEYENISLANANMINQYLMKAHNKINFKPININITKKKKQVMSANGENLWISVNWLGKKQQEKLMNFFKKDFKANNIDNIKWYEKELAKPDISSGKRKNLEFGLANAKKELKYRIGHVTNESDLLESIIDHEIGHVIHGQRMNKYKSVLNEPIEIRNLRNEWTKIYDKLKETGEITNISKYATTNDGEGFAECFSMYFFEKDKLPKNIIKFIDKVLKND
jgi:hypothetical protein